MKNVKLNYKSLLLIGVIMMLPITSQGQFKYGEVLQKSMFFYEAQRAGKLPDNNRVSWRGNACLNDGSDVGIDLSKGWFDAGDHVKFNFPMAWTVTVLSWGALEYPEGYTKNGQMEYLLDNIRWATDYLISCHPSPNVYYYQVGDGDADHAKWTAAEVIEHLMERPTAALNTSTPGSEVSAETAAAFAAASMLFKDSDPDYSATLLQHAKDLFAFADNYRGNYPLQKYYKSWNGYNDELTWGAIWLYKATGNNNYLSKAKTTYNDMAKEIGTSTPVYKHTFSWDDKAYACYVILALETGETKYITDAERYLDHWAYNIERTPAGLPYQADNNWGILRYASNTALCAMVYSDFTNNATKKGDYYNMAKSIIDYALGDNPENLSYVIGHGNDWPKHIHHRTAHGWPDGFPGSEVPDNRHILYGALAGGPDFNDNYIDDINQYQYTEVACDYNAGFSGVVAKLAKDNPATALSNFPIQETPDKQIYVQMKLNVSNPNGFELYGELINASAWPAMYSENLAFRYYIDISEGVAAGYSAADYKTGGSGTVSGLIPWDEDNNIYYVEVELKNKPIYPGGQGEKLENVQIQISLPGAEDSAFDPTNDWSYQGVSSTSQLVYNQYMPTYEFGTHLDGIEPGGGTIVPVTGVIVSPTTSSIEAGQSLNLTASISPSNATDKTVGWNSTNDGIATVDNSGKVVGIAPGSATITVATNDGNYKASAEITVTKKPDVPCTGVTINPKSISLGIGQTNSLNVAISPSNATNKSVTWSSDKTSVASVDENGVITGIAPGTAKVTVKTADGGWEDFSTVTVKEAPTYNTYTQRFLDLRAKMNDPANGYFSKDGVPYHSVESLIAEAPDHGHETTSEAYSYWIWMEAMYGGVTGDWSYLNNAWDKMEQTAIPRKYMQPNTDDYNPSDPASYAAEHPLPSFYPSELEPNVPVGEDPVSNDLTSTYGDSIYAMHWLFDCDNFYGYGNMGDGVSTPSYINTFQRGPQESVWETVPHPSWEDFTWGDPDKGGFLGLFIDEANPTQQWRYTNAPDADARAVQAMYWATQFAKEQGLDPKATIPIEKASKMGDFVRLSMFDKYFKPLGVQDKMGPGGKGYESAHYLMSWYFSWGGPLESAGWAWRISSSHIHFGYQNPVAAYALSNVDELKPVSKNGARDWGNSLQRMLEFYTWLQSSEGAIAGGATNSYNGNYEAYPETAPTFYDMAYQEHPVYHDPGSNEWIGMQAWSMERISELYYITNNPLAKNLMDNWVSWIKSVVRLLPNRQFEIPATLIWTGQPETWDPANPKKNSDLHVTVDKYGTDLGITGCMAKALTYYAAATKKYETLDTEARDLAKELLDRMWENYYEPSGLGVAVAEERGDYTRFFEQEVFVPEGYNGKMPNGDIVEPGVKFIDIRSGYRNDKDFEKLENAYKASEKYKTKYHRYWAQSDIALANAEYGRFFGDDNTTKTPVSGVALSPKSAKIKVGENLELTVSIQPSNATNKAVTWEITPQNIVSIDNGGLLTGLATGNATVIVKTEDGGFTDTCKVEVEDTPIIAVTDISVDPRTATIGLDETINLRATVSPSNATNKKVSWGSSAQTIATVDQNGVVTPIGAGNVEIVVKTDDGGYTDTSRITINGPVQYAYPNGVPHAIPGTIEAVHFDVGDAGIAYQDSDNVHQGDGPRDNTYVDTEYRVPNGNVGWIAQDEWLEYTVNAEEGTYTIDIQIASETSNGKFHIEFNGTDATNVQAVPNTGNWDKFETLTINNVAISAGEQIMRVYMDGNSFNIAAMQFTKVGAPIPVTGIELDCGNATVKTGLDITLSETVLPSNATNKNVVWKSSDPAILSISGNGIATGISKGIATITVTTQDGDFSESCKIEVIGSGSGCNFDIPRASALPSVNTEYDYVFTKGTAPDLSFFRQFSINWSLENNGLWVYALNIDKTPWYVPMHKNNYSFDKANPSITISGSGIGIDGEYYVNALDGYFVMGEKSGAYTIVFSKSPIAPCAEMKQAASSVKDIQVAKIKVYPNPFKDEINIYLSNASDVKKINIYSTTGQLVKTFDETEIQTTNQLKLNTSASMYFIHLITNKETIVKSIIKN